MKGNVFNSYTCTISCVLIMNSKIDCIRTSHGIDRACLQTCPNKKDEEGLYENGPAAKVVSVRKIFILHNNSLI